MNELAIANPVRLQDLKVIYAGPKTPEAKEYPRSTKPFMRWQVRVWEKRDSEALRIKVSVERLLGVGETKAAAERMARRVK